MYGGQAASSSRNPGACAGSLAAVAKEPADEDEAGRYRPTGQPLAAATVAARRPSKAVRQAADGQARWHECAAAPDMIRTR